MELSMPSKKEILEAFMQNHGMSEEQANKNYQLVVSIKDGYEELFTRWENEIADKANRYIPPNMR